jgi:hypothetical protein
MDRGEKVLSFSSVLGNVSGSINSPVVYPINTCASVFNFQSNMVGESPVIRVERGEKSFFL